MNEENVIVAEVEVPVVEATEATTAPTAETPEVLGYGQTGEGEVATATDVVLV